MEFKLGHTQAKQLAAQYGEVLKSKNRGKTDASKADPKDCKWSFSYGVMVQSMSGADLMDMIRTGKKMAEPPKLTPEEATDDQLSRISGSLCCSFGKKYWYSDTPIKGKDVPGLRENILKDLIKREAEENKEKARKASLTPAQRKAEEQDLLDQFFAGGGVMISPAGIRTKNGLM